MNERRPTFLTSYLDSLSASVEKRGVWAVIPYWLALCVALGAVISFYIPDHFWSEEKLDVSVPVYAAFLTLNGLVLALSWSAFSRVYESLSEPNLLKVLVKHELLNGYVFYLGYVNASQIASVLSSIAGLSILILELSDHNFNRLALTLTIGTSVYAIKQASHAVTVMHDLLWQQSQIEASTVTGNDDKIRPLRRD